MIFSELYSAYYNTVAAIISGILDGERSEKELQRIVADRAFGESVLTVLPSLKSGRWQLVHPDMTTALTHKPTMPLTALQRSWLKAISLDPRMKLFDVSLPELGDAEPLFTPEDICVYDKYSDGDPFDDEEYIRQFRVVLEAIRTGSHISFEMTDRRGRDMHVRCRPMRLEYSEKDDKFRVITVGRRSVSTVRLAGMRACCLCEGDARAAVRERTAVYDTATVRILDERNAMERFMLSFAHFEKQAERLDGKHYLVKIRYVREDISEMVIRLLSFGPMVEVLGSETLRGAVIEKLKKQLSCGLR